MPRELEKDKCLHCSLLRLQLSTTTTTSSSIAMNLFWAFRNLHQSIWKYYMGHSLYVRSDSISKWTHKKTKILLESKGILMWLKFGDERNVKKLPTFFRSWKVFDVCVPLDVTGWNLLFFIPTPVTACLISIDLKQMNRSDL